MIKKTIIWSYPTITYDERRKYMADPVGQWNIDATGLIPLSSIQVPMLSIGLVVLGGVILDSSQWMIVTRAFMMLPLVMIFT